MRLFYLQKETGERIDLNNKNGIFLSEPSGLGLEFGDDFADIGEGFFRMISKVHTQKTVQCKLNFVGDNPYLIYNDFITWCMNAKKLFFIYKPLNIEYYIRTEISTFDKNEINKYGYLEVPSKFLYLSPWYRPSPINIPFIGISDNAFRCDVTKLDGPSILVGSLYLDYAAQIDPNGHLPGAIYLEYHGAAENPEIILEGVDSGTIYGDCKIESRFASNTGFKLSTSYEDSFIRKINANGSEDDLLSHVDLSLEPFFKIPLTESCILRLVDDGVINGELSAKVYYYYRSV